MKTKFKSCFLFFAFLATMFVSCSMQEKPKKPVKEENIGVLDNGFSYYVKENKYDKEKASLRLLVRVGSLQEEESERGLAHFLEHMVFRGSESYADYEVIDFLESIGASFGADTNAYTSFDQTVYMFEVPLNKEGTLEKALSMLSEFAMKANIDDQLVDKEKTVVMDELRLRENSACGRTSTQMMEILFENTKYGERLPIGLEKVIQNATGEQIKAFYKKWYRPENMAVVAVGDFSAEDVMKHVHKYFGSLPKSREKNIPERIALEGYDNDFVKVVKDPETQGNVFIAANFLESNKAVTEEDLFLNLQDQMIFSMQNRRLSNLSQAPDTPFKFAMFSKGRMNYHSSIYAAMCITWDDRPLAGFQSLLEEKKKFETFDFSQKEFDLALASSKSNLKVAIENVDKNKNDKYINSYTSHFLFGEALLGVKEEAELELKLLDKINLDVLNERKHSLVTKSPLCVVYMPPQAENIASKEEVENSLNAFSTLVVEQEKEEAAKEFPIASSLPKGSIDNREEFEVTGVSKLTLSNGMKVYLEKTDLKENLFTIQLSSSNGLSSFPQEELLSASIAPAYGQRSGLSGLTSIELRDVLTGKEVSVNYSFSPTERIISGGSNNEDMDYMFKMIQSLFTDKYFREESWEQQVKMYDEDYTSKKNNPNRLFLESIERFNSSNHYYFSDFAPTELDKVKAESALTNAFRNPTEFTMIIVGDFDEKKLISALETYIASIPASNESFPKPLFSEFTIPKGVHENVFKKGIGKEAIVLASFPLKLDHLENSRETISRLSVFKDALRAKLLKVLRREKGETYGVHIGVNVPFYPSMSSSMLNIYFPTSPEMVKEMKELMLTELQNLQKEPFSHEEVQTALQIAKESNKKAMKANSGRLKRIHEHLENGMEPSNFVVVEDKDALFEKDLFNDEILKCIDLENYILHIKVPESSEYEG